MQATLADRQAEMAKTRQTLEHDWAEKSRQTVEVELTAARTAWEAEIEGRLAAAAAGAASNS